MKPKYPIYVISKGRFENPLTSKKLSRMKQPHYLVVEPQEYNNYKKTLGEYATLLVTPFSNLGLGSIPVRNFVWGHSKENGDNRHWILDDNLANFYFLKNGKRVLTYDRSIFYYCESFVDKYSNVPMAGMNYMTFAIPHKNIKPFRLNTRVYSIILLSNKHKIDWRGKYNEDTDLSLRFLKKGYCTILFNAFLADKVATLTMKGGNEKIYDETNNRFEFAESLRRQHPDCVKIVKKWGRYHHSVDYKRFTTKLIKKK